MGGGRRVDKRHGQFHRLLLCQRAGDPGEGPLCGHGQTEVPLWITVQEVIFTVRRGREFQAQFGERVRKVPVFGAGAAGCQGRGRE